MTDEPLVQELLSVWERGLAAGRDVPAAELCRDRPDLASELESRIHGIRQLNALAGAAGASAPASPFDQVVSLCEGFTGEWDRQARPSLDAYLARAGPEAQPALLRNLLAIEVQRRRAAGERPAPDEYLGRLPSEFAGLVRDVFLRLSTVDDAALPNTAPPGPAARPPAAGQLGDYQLLRELGRGGMGVVYEARHVRRGDLVALKTLPAVDGAALHRFKREFRALADINHPNLVGLHTLEADGGQWFFTMDFLQGEDFLSHVRPRGALDESRLRAALAQLARGVMALHARHVVHRDLKPGNVMVTHDGRVVLLDFGLVAELDRAAGAHSSVRVAGTPAYMAPEQCAGGAVTPAGDWYAVGVMLYEALCGRLPFTGGMLKVLQDKQLRDPPPLPAGAARPGDLAALALRLLARAPQDRADALEVASVVSAGAGSASAPEAPRGQQLVGREPHLAALAEAHRALQRRGEPQTVFVSGRSGEGKTALAEHFLAPLREDARLVVMSGRCYDRESVPFKALDTLIDALAGYLRSLPATDAALLIPDDIGALVQVFPVLQRVEVVAQAAVNRLAGLDDQQVRQRAFRALRSLLTRIGRHSLVMWFIDDLQWGDADSAAALFEVLRPPEAPAVLFLGTYRSDETEGSAFLTSWQELQRKHDVRFAAHEVKVGPLTAAECVEMVIGLVGLDTEAVRRRAAEFARETRGNPFLLTELVGCFDPDSDSFEPMPLHELLARKLGRLPAEAGGLLEVVAVSGQALSLEEAARTAGQALPPVATLTRMRNERLVRLVGSGESPRVDTYHDRVRETVLGHMDDGKRRVIHRKLAEVIEEGGGGVTAERLASLEVVEEGGGKEALPRVYDLAYHFDAAGERRKARAYALLAAEQARRQSALEVAANNYAVARRNAEGTGNAARYRIAKGYGESLMLLGRYEEAKEQLNGAVDLVDDAEKKARIEAILGNIASKDGHLGQSIALLHEGLNRLGVWIPRSRLGLFYGLTRESLVQCLHSLLPLLRHRKAPSSRLDLIAEMLFRSTASHIFQNTLKFVWAAVSSMNRAELVPPSPLLTRNYAVHSMLMSMLGWQGRGNRFRDRAEALTRETDDLLIKGASRNYQGIGCYASARYEEGIARLTEAIEAFSKAGDQWEVHLAHFHKGCCHFGLGNLAEAVAEARWTFAASTRVGDSRSLCSSYLWARATRGNLPFEELKSCLPCRPDDVMSTVHGMMAEGHWHTFHGRTEEALHAFERAGEMVRKSFCVNSHMIVVMPELAGALRRHADAVQSKDERQAEQLRRRSYRVAKWAARIARLFPAAYPLALRERSLILAAYGKTKKALKYADRSCAVAEAQKAKYEHAQSLLVRGKLAKELGRPEADEQVRTAEAALDVMEKAALAARP